MINTKKLIQATLTTALLSTAMYAQALSIVTEQCTTDPQKRDNFLNWQADYDQYCLPFYYNDEYAIGKKGNKWAIFDVKAKKPLTDFIYDDVNYFFKGSKDIDRLFIIKKNGKWGTLDTLGKETLFQQDFDYVFTFNEGLALAKKDGKFGMIDLKGNVVIPLEYDAMDTFSHGFASVTKNDKASFIDKQGKLLIPFLYDATYNFGENGLSAVFDKNRKKLALINNQGKLVSSFVYDDVKITEEPVTIVIKDKKAGLVDKTGKLLTPIEYQAAVHPSGNEGNIGFSKHLLIVKDTRTNKYGMFDNKGNVVVPFIYDEEFWFYWDLALVKKDGKQGFLDRHFKVIIPIKYDYANDDNNGLLRVVKNGKTGFYNRTGKLVIPIIYTIADDEDFDNGKIKVTLNGKSFYIDMQGKRIAN